MIGLGSDKYIELNRLFLIICPVYWTCPSAVIQNYIVDYIDACFFCSCYTPRNIEYKRSSPLIWSPSTFSTTQRWVKKWWNLIAMCSKLNSRPNRAPCLPSLINILPTPPKISSSLNLDQHSMSFFKAALNACRRVWESKHAAEGLCEGANQSRTTRKS